MSVNGNCCTINDEDGETNRIEDCDDSNDCINDNSSGHSNEDLNAVMTPLKNLIDALVTTLMVLE